MAQRKKSKWKQIFGKMILNMGRVNRDLYGSAAGATIIDMPESKRLPKQKRRHKRKQ